MKKCNVCGKTISDFSEVCPHCHSNPSQITSEDATEKKKIYANRKKVCIMLAIHLFAVLFFYVVFLMVRQKAVIRIYSQNIISFDGYIWLNCLLNVAFIVITCGASLPLLIKNKILSMSNNRTGIIIAWVAAGVLVIYNFVRILIGSVPFWWQDLISVPFSAALLFCMVAEVCYLVQLLFFKKQCNIGGGKQNG